MEPFRIVHIDDEPDRLGEFKDHVDSRDLDWVVASFENGIDALPFIIKRPPHLVLADVSMPHINGAQLTEMVSLSSPFSKVAFLSALDENARKKYGLMAFQFIDKPLDDKAFEKIVEILNNDIDVRNTEIIKAISKYNSVMNEVQSDNLFSLFTSNSDTYEGKSEKDIEAEQIVSKDFPPLEVIESNPLILFDKKFKASVLSRKHTARNCYILDEVHGAFRTRDFDWGGLKYLGKWLEFGGSEYWHGAKLILNTTTKLLSIVGGVDRYANKKFETNEDRQRKFIPHNHLDAIDYNLTSKLAWERLKALEKSEPEKFIGQ